MSTETNIQDDILDVLRKHSKEEHGHKYINPNFLQEVSGLLDNYFKVQDDDVDEWIRDMWSA